MAQKRHFGVISSRTPGLADPFRAAHRREAVMASTLGRIGVLVVLMVALVASIAIADGTVQGTLSVKVLDENGQSLPGVLIELVSSDKGFQRSQTSDAEGSVTFALLQPGPYTVRATLQGFQD